MALWIGKQIDGAEGLFYSDKEKLEAKGAKVYNSIIAEGAIINENIEVGNKEITLGKEQITVIGKDEVVSNNIRVEGK